MSGILRVLTILGLVAAGFTIAHALLTFVVIAPLYQIMIYHYSDKYIWVALFFGMPFCAGLVFCFAFRGRVKNKSAAILIIVVLFFQTAFSTIAIHLNSRYWGYSLTRPTIFVEVLNAYKIISFSSLSNNERIDDSTFAVRIVPLHLEVNKAECVTELSTVNGSWYEHGIMRVIQAFGENAPRYPDLYDIDRIYKNDSMRLAVSDLRAIDQLLSQSEIIDIGSGSAEEVRFSAWAIEFLTRDEKHYVFMAINGGQVANDHYPFYEFLFIKSREGLRSVKEMRYYTDRAGIEGIEYATVGPVFSMLVVILSPVFFGIIYFIQWIRKDTSNWMI